MKKALPQSNPRPDRGSWSVILRYATLRNYGRLVAYLLLAFGVDRLVFQDDISSAFQWFAIGGVILVFTD